MRLASRRSRPGIDPTVGGRSSTPAGRPSSCSIRARPRRWTRSRSGGASQARCGWPSTSTTPRRSRARSSRRARPERASPSTLPGATETSAFERPTGCSSRSSRSPTRADARVGYPRARVMRLPAAIPFGITIGLSAFLLFSVEPLVGRMVLPVFGGAAGVWATVLAFFQAVLLLGYLYAHFSATRLSARAAVLVHLVLAALAAAATIAAPRSLAEAQVGGLPALLGLLYLLTITIGPAAFVLTATTPLLSAW